MTRKAYEIGGVAGRWCSCVEVSGTKANTSFKSRGSRGSGSDRMIAREGADRRGDRKWGEIEIETNKEGT